MSHGHVPCVPSICGHSRYWATDPNSASELVPADNSFLIAYLLESKEIAACRGRKRLSVWVVFFCFVFLMQALGFKINISSSCRGRQHKTCRRILSSCYFPVTRRQQGRKKGISLSSLSGLQMHSATYLPPFVHIVFGLAGACFIILPQTCSQSNAATPLVCRRCRSTEHTTADSLSCHFFSCASWCGLLLHQVAHCFPFHDGTGAALAWLQVTDAEYLVCFSSSIPWCGRDASRSPSITCLAGQG